MSRSVRLALLAMLLSWTLAHPLAVGANDPAANIATKTPIKHLVVIFDENISFDHYFGTSPTLSISQEKPRRSIPRRIRRWSMD